MAIKTNRYKVEHKNFVSMADAFQDCVRYSKALEIAVSTNEAVIEIPQSANPSMRKEWSNLCLIRWESCGFKLTKM